MAIKKKAQIHNKKIGIENSKENNKITEEKISITLNTSPVKTNIPFSSKSPAQKRINCRRTFTPKISIRKASPPAISIAPRIFTKTIF